MLETLKRWFINNELPIDLARQCSKIPKITAGEIRLLNSVFEDSDDYVKNEIIKAAVVGSIRGQVLVNINDHSPHAFHNIDYTLSRMMDTPTYSLSWSDFLQSLNT